MLWCVDCITVGNNVCICMYCMYIYISVYIRSKYSEDLHNFIFHRGATNSTERDCSLFMDKTIVNNFFKSINMVYNFKLLNHFCGKKTHNVNRIQLEEKCWNSNY